MPNPAVIANTRDGTGRIAVASQNGIIRMVQNGTVLATPFLDLTSRVTQAPAAGMGGLVFSPSYATNGFVYVDYPDANNNLVLLRYKVSAGNPNVADPTSATPILSVPAGYPNTPAGHLAFGQDGTLYVGVAAGNSNGDPLGNGQNMGVLNGKILRLNVEAPGCTNNPPTNPNYCIPANNPFIGTAGVRPEIWASGLRNPWVFSFDTATWGLYIADVGENREEEVDFQPAVDTGGENYGWNTLEGDLCFNPISGCVTPARYSAPVTVYDHGVNDSYGCGIIGGFVDRSVVSPSLQGIYFYGDYCTGRIWGLQQSSGSWVSTQLTQAPWQISTFGLTQGGEVLVADYTDGSIYQLISFPTGGTATPTPTPTQTPTAQPSPTVGVPPSKEFFLPVIMR
jgi:hypothetical protein